MVDLEALHNAVLDATAEDGPRVAYAVAIAPSDPDRAEYIQRALEHAAHPRDSSPAGTANALRMQRLQDANATRWNAHLPTYADGYGMRRGFVEDVRLDAATFLTHAASLYRLAPIQHLTLTGAKPVAHELFASPLLRQIVSLSLMHNELDDGHVSALAASRHLGKLRWLHLGFNQIATAGLEALAASGELPSLGYVGLGHNLVPDPSPAHADEYDADTKAAIDLQRRHGRRRWLSAKPPRPAWPPSRDSP